MTLALLAMTYNLCGLMTLVGWALAIVAKYVGDPTAHTPSQVSDVDAMTILIGLGALMMLFWPLILVDMTFRACRHRTP